MLLLYYQMYTHRGTLGNILVFLVSVAGILSSFVRYQFLNFVDQSQMGAAVYTTVWVTVLFSSITCLMLYLRLLYSCLNIPNLWAYSIRQLRVPKLGLCIAVAVNGALGVFAVLVLRKDMMAIAERVEIMEMHIVWRTIFHVLYYTRIFQRSFECECVAGDSKCLLVLSAKWACSASIVNNGLSNMLFNLSLNRTDRTKCVLVSIIMNRTCVLM